MEPDRTRTAAEVALDLFARRAEVAFFCNTARVHCPLIALSDMSTSRSLPTILSSTTPPEFAGSSLRILSSVHHNGQRPALQEFSYWKDLA